jgi:putative flavoprotein involved in K+ transport
MLGLRFVGGLLTAFMLLNCGGSTNPDSRAAMDSDASAGGASGDDMECAGAAGDDGCGGVGGERPLEAYARHFKLPVRSGSRVERLTREADRYVVIAAGRRLEAGHVVVAMASYQRPNVPAFAKDLDPAIVQMKSLDYRRPDQLPPGNVLVVGAANSGAEIALDLVRSGRSVWLSGRNPGEVPFPIEHPLTLRLVVPILFRVVFHRIMTVDTPIGRRVRPDFMKKGLPLIRTRFADLRKAGVTLVPRTEGVSDGRPQLADGTVLDVASVVWATGFDIGRQWIELPVFDDRDEPIQHRGIVTSEPGLYFVGMPFLYSVTSDVLPGVGRDAGRIAKHIARFGRKARTGIHDDAPLTPELQALGS